MGIKNVWCLAGGEDVELLFWSAKELIAFNAFGPCTELIGFLIVLGRH